MPKLQRKITSINNNSFIYSQNTEFTLVSGEKLSYLDLAYETYGELNPNRDNVILLHHSLSMSAHAYNYEQPDNDADDYDYDHKSQNGWWDNMIGIGKPLDPSKYFIICINNLGSCFGSTGPSDYKGEFPVITIHDMVISQKLLLDYLGIDKLKLIIGSSVGGMLSLAWLQLYPESVDNLFVAACALKAYPINIYNRMLQQEIIKLAGQDKKEGLKVARMLGFFNYRSTEELIQRFGDTNIISDNEFRKGNRKDVYLHSELYKYYSYNADKFINKFDTESYLCMLNAMDLFDLSLEKTYHHAGFKGVNPNTNITVVGIDSDILFPIDQQREICQLLSHYGYNPHFIEHRSSYGHDAFLIEHKEFGEYISNIL